MIDFYINDKLGQDEYLMIDDTKQVKYDKNSKEIWKNY